MFATFITVLTVMGCIWGMIQRGADPEDAGFAVTAAAIVSYILGAWHCRPRRIQRRRHA